MKRTVFLFGLLMCAVSPCTGFAEPAGAPTVAPEFRSQEPTRWLVAAPRTMDSLKGKVVLINFWTCLCSNCIASLPWLTEFERHHRWEGLAVVGVHTPELEAERDVRKITERIKTSEIEYPVYLDNDYDLWKKYGNESWPAFYLIDKHGRVRAKFTGETHVGDRQSEEIATRVKELLREE